MLLYHLSNKILNSTMEPRIPKNFLTEQGYEDSVTPRVCLCSSISNCLKAMSADIKGKIFFVYATRIDDPYKPTVDEVPDSEVTGEYWSLKPIKIQRLYAIKIFKAKKENPKNIYQYGKNFAQLYDWNYIVLPDWYLSLLRFNNHLNSFNYENNVNFNTYTIKDPLEFENQKNGICWDFVVDEADWLENKNIPYDCYFTNLFDKNNKLIATHTYILIPWKDKQIYFESSWQKYKGVYFISSYKIIEKLLKKFYNANKVYTINYDPLETVGATDKEFFQYLRDFGADIYE